MTFFKSRWFLILFEKKIVKFKFLNFSDLFFWFFLVKMHLDLSNSNEPLHFHFSGKFLPNQAYNITFRGRFLILKFFTGYLLLFTGPDSLKPTNRYQPNILYTISESQYILILDANKYSLIPMILHDLQFGSEPFYRPRKVVSETCPC